MPRNPSAFKVRVNKKMYSGTKVLGIEAVKGRSRLTDEVRDGRMYVLHRIGQISQSRGRELSTGYDRRRHVSKTFCLLVSM